MRVGGTGAVAMRPSPARLGYVDGLRALAALYVVAGHMGQSLWPRQNPTGWPGALTGALGFGHFAVSVFIVLSGYSLMLPVARNGYRLPHGIGGFYWRRARRILPPYYLAMGLSLLLIWLAVGRATGTFWDTSLPVTAHDVAAHLLLLHDFSLADGFKINYVFWSIAVECQIYLVFPALVALWRRYPAPLALAMALAGSFALMLAALLTGIPALTSPAGSAFIAPYTGLFAMGMFAAGLREASAPVWERLRSWRVWEVAALVAFTLLVARVSAWPISMLDLCAGVMASGVLLAASHPGALNPLRVGLEWRPLVWIGSFFYSLYLIHAPLIQVLWQYVARPLGWGEPYAYLALLLVGVPLMVLAAWGFWFVCKRPFLNARPVSTGHAWRWLRRGVVKADIAR